MKAKCHGSISIFTRELSSSFCHSWHVRVQCFPVAGTNYPGDQKPISDTKSVNNPLILDFLASRTVTKILLINYSYFLLQQHKYNKILGKSTIWNLNVTPTSIFLRRNKPRIKQYSVLKGSFQVFYLQFFICLKGKTSNNSSQ